MVTNFFSTLTTPLNRLPREARDALLMVGVIALVLAPHLTNLPLWCSVMAIAVLVWRAKVAIHNQQLPGRWTLIGLLFSVVAATYLEHRSLVGQQAGVTLLVLLLMLKTMELRARRDAYVVFFLSFFTILTAFFNSQSLGTAALVLLAFFGLMMALINANMPASTPSLTLLASQAGKLMIWGAPLMLALFVFFPRFAPLWGVPNPNPQGKTGLSDQMEVGSMASLAMDESLAFRIQFEGEAPPQRQMYFRGPVLDHFDGRRWESSMSPWSLANSQELGIQTSGPSLRYEVTMEPNHLHWVFTLDMSEQAPDLPPPYRTRLSPQLQWVTNRPITRTIRYQAQSIPRFTYAPKRDSDLKPHYLKLPAGFDPRTLALAQSLKSQHPNASAEEFGAMVFDRLRTGGYTYTLDPGVYPQNTADHFWFDGKAGFCEHIASAFVVLMRAAGYPSRIVTGYQGAERNAIDGYWQVQQANAHAWTEVWDEKKGWIRMDPTEAVMPGRVGAFERLYNGPAGVAILRDLSPTLINQMRFVWDAANNAWTQRVLNYSQGDQLKLLQGLGFESPSWRDMFRLLAILLAVAVLSGLLILLMRKKKQDPWLRLLQRAHGRWRPENETSPILLTPHRLYQMVESTEIESTILRAWHDWLDAMEQWRYAQSDTKVSLAVLHRQLRQLPPPSNTKGRTPAHAT